MKTAMQEIKHMLEVLFANTDIVTIESLLDYIQNKGLQDEKEQLIKAHIDGFDHIVVDFKKQEYAEEYYNETYNQNES